jgi:hypothetical protein
MDEWLFVAVSIDLSVNKLSMKVEAGAFINSNGIRAESTPLANGFLSDF